VGSKEVGERGNGIGRMKKKGGVEERERDGCY
jgi:hypothetical protein